jgi:hypothetical protein
MVECGPPDYVNKIKEPRFSRGSFFVDTLLAALLIQVKAFAFDDLRLDCLDVGIAEPGRAKGDDFYGLLGVKHYGVRVDFHFFKFRLRLWHPPFHAHMALLLLIFLEKPLILSLT